MDRSSVTITLYKSELIFDIQNKTYLTGRSRQTGANHEEVANMQANDDDENLNQLLRSIGNAFSALKTKLSEYLEIGQNAGDNVLFDDETNLELTLKMPTNYNQATVDTISSAMHQYIVNVSISWGDWKHEHMWCKILMEYIGFREIGEMLTEEDGSDCYSATHIFIKEAA